MSIHEAAVEAVALSYTSRQDVEFEFNGIRLIASVGSDPRDITKIYDLHCQIRQLEEHIKEINPSQPMSTKFVNSSDYLDALNDRFITACGAYRDHVLEDGFNYDNSAVTALRNAMKDAALDIYNFRQEEHNRKCVMEEQSQ